MSTPQQKHEAVKLIKWTNNFPEKDAIVAGVSDHRTVHLGELYEWEMLRLLKWLDKLNKSMCKQRLKVFAYCHLLKWQDGEGKVDEAHLNAWLEKYGHIKKHLNRQSKAELSKTITQIERMVTK